MGRNAKSAAPGQQSRVAGRLADLSAEQAATREILRVINGSPGDAAPVFESIARAALTLCKAESAVVATYDGSMLRIGALASTTTAGADAIRAVFPRPASRDNGATRAVYERATISIADVRRDAEYATGTPAVAAGFRSVLAVPLMEDDRPIGVISLGRATPGAFPDEHVRLLETFAAQAVIAILNTRRFVELGERNRELANALEQQTATAEILRVISRSPTDVQPVFETIAQSALRLCSGVFSALFRFDGQLIHVGALANATPDIVAALGTAYPCPPHRQGTTQRAILTREIVHMPDVRGEAEYRYREVATSAGFRSVVSIPMLHRNAPVGAITVYRDVVGPFPPDQVELLKTFADQAVIAIENVRLFGELEERSGALTRSVGELRALGEVGEAVSATLDLDTVLGTIVERATRLTGMDSGSIYEYDAARGEFELRTAHRLPAELFAALKATPMRKGEGALGRMALTLEPVEIHDLSDESVYRSHVRELLLGLGYRSVVAVPLVRESQLLGGIVVNRRKEGAFDSGTISLLRTLASQSALALQNARLYREVEQKRRELEAASRHKSEFLANMSHELRTPLNAIIGFSEVLAERMFGELNAKQAEYIDDILSSGRHLLSLINDILDLSKIEAGRMELDCDDIDVAATVDAALALVRERAHRRGVELRPDVDRRLGHVRADERKVKQILLNLLSNALKFTPEGGSIGVRARAANGGYEISVTDTGVGIAAADQAAVFEEFRQVGSATKKAEGTGLGLAISRKYAELHGGSLTVASELGHGATFTLTLPR